MDDAIRWANASLSVAIAVFGSRVWFRWPVLTPAKRRLWMGVALLNFSVLVGSLEQIYADVPVGIRTYLLSISLVWLLVSVSELPTRRELNEGGPP